MASEKSSGEMYRCASCDATFDDYVVLDDDSIAGTAACPECRQPSLRLARD
ncbi:hypothetical protein [Halorubrum tebenquichense]|nr:hypothetical protein [Halorubrum tebenquichense]